jgi:hypothetical protein
MPRCNEEVEHGFDEFRNGLKRSSKGNLWRTWAGVTVTVFRGEDGFRFCIADGAGPRWSEGAWLEEDEAVRALWVELEGE